MMKIVKSIKRLLDDAKLSDSYWIEKAKLDFSILLDRRRIKSKMTCGDLAKRLETSRPYVSKVFRGDANLTIETMVKLARATGGELDIRIVDAEVCSTQPPVDSSRKSEAIAFPVEWAKTMTQPQFRTAKIHQTGSIETWVSSGLRSANEHQWVMEAAV